MFRSILQIYGEKNAKKYLSKFMELHGCIFDKNYFCSRFRKLNSYTETFLEFLMLLKGNVFQKCTVMVVPCHGIIFHISVSTSCFCFHSYFGRPFGSHSYYAYISWKTGWISYFLCFSLLMVWMIFYIFLILNWS